MLPSQTDLDNESLLLKLSLARITFLTLEEKKKFANLIDSASKLALFSIEEIQNLTGRSFSKKVIWNGKENLRLAKAALYRCVTSKIGLVFYEDPEYPEVLRQIADAPYLLFYRGNVSLLAERTVSIVGTRRVTPAGRQAATQFAYEAAKDGVCVLQVV